MQRAASTLARALSGWLIIGLVTISGESERVTVVYTSEAAPYSEALEGLRAALPNSALTVVDLRSPNAEEDLARSLASGSKQLVVTIGKEALERVSARGGHTPLVATMIMRSEQERMGRITAAVHLDIPVTDVLAEVKRIFPRTARVAVIRNPTQPGQVDSNAVAHSRQQGIALRVVDAKDPEELLRAVRSLNERVDFVMCLPDSGLYNGTTVKPLILAGLESHLLIVGFSSSFVRAGAGVGVYPDFRDIGVQAGEVARRELAGQPVPNEQGPRKLVGAVNQRVIHLLGLEYQPQHTEQVVIFR